MTRKAGQGKEEEESRARQEKEKTPVREEEKTPARHGGGHHVVEQDEETGPEEIVLIQEQALRKWKTLSPALSLYESPSYFWIQQLWDADERDSSQPLGQEEPEKPNSYKLVLLIL
ncbi:hypothetical protein STEG23_017202 [Scotinomys teguina]